MKVLFTGASCFTGYWFVKQLAAAGHEVTATFRNDSLEAYEGIRAARVKGLSGSMRPVTGCAFGDQKFMDLLRSSRFDVACLHGADVTNYKSPEFDVAKAVATNTLNVGAVMEALAGTSVVITGSVFEGGEGAGSQGLPHFSAYGLSKALSAQTFQFYAQRCGVPLGKFVIANPFGPYEEPRFTSYLIRTWYAGKTAGVNTPLYVRDNVHVSLMAREYVSYVESAGRGEQDPKLCPSGYVESVGSFAQRFAAEMRPRLNLDCKVELAEQTDFSEPRIRLATDPCDAHGWNEAAAWDELAAYYKSVHS